MKLGATGIGAHKDYMGVGIHVGFGAHGARGGPITVWGKGESSTGAPDWLRALAAEAGRPKKRTSDT